MSQLQKEKTHIDQMYENFDECLKLLASEVSLKIEMDKQLKKVLLISSASFFEYEITQSIKIFTTKNTDAQRLQQFVQTRAISRQYHTYFEWKAKNANQFFKMFGVEFQKKVRQVIDDDGILLDSEKSFMELGKERNILTHENFGENETQKTLYEVYELYQKAYQFTLFLKDSLNWNEEDYSKE